MKKTTRRKSSNLSSDSQGEVDYEELLVTSPPALSTLNATNASQNAVPPSHRLSTTPLFPSPLAQAMYEDDSIDILDVEAARAIEESESSEADDEADVPTLSATSRQRGASSPRAAGSRSPIRTFDRIKTHRARESSR